MLHSPAARGYGRSLPSLGPADPRCPGALLSEPAAGRRSRERVPRWLLVEWRFNSLAAYERPQQEFRCCPSRRGMESQITSSRSRRVMIRIAIADDHPILLDGLQFLFKQQADIEVVARCETAEEALSHVDTTRPDVLVLDVRMRGKDGLWVLEQLADDPGTRVVLLTAGVENSEIARALTLGARGVVLKDRTGEDLVRCVRTVYSGGRWFDERVFGRAMDHIGGRTREPIAGVQTPLTRREIEVIPLVAEGLRNKEIGERLSISECTVKTHLRSIFSKLLVDGRVELAIWAREQARG